MANPQNPDVHYWAPGSAIPIAPDALRRLGISLPLESTVLPALLEAAFMTHLLKLAEDLTDGRKAIVINLIAEFTRLTVTRLRAVQDEAVALAGGANEPFMGRVLSR